MNKLKSTLLYFLVISILILTTGCSSNKTDQSNTNINTIYELEQELEILKEENDADKEVCILSAYWHDVGRMYGKEGHGVNSAEMLKSELNKNNYNDEFIQKCYKAICKHDTKEIPETLEGIIVKDADKIDAVGIERWKACVESNQRLPRIFPNLREEMIIRESSKKMYDKNARKLIEYLSKIIKK